MSELVKCATCKTEKPFSEMQTCMRAEREHSVCDMNCMIKLYKGEIKPDTVVTPDLEEMVKLGMNPKEYHLHKENLELRAQLAKANDYTAELEVRKEALEESLNGCTEKVLCLSGKLAKANERVEELERFQEEVAYRCFTAGLNTEKPKGPSGKNQTATEINHFEVMVNSYVIGTSRSILEQLRKEQY